jgi:hypothetical protein
LEGDDKLQLIEAYREDDVWFPRRGLGFWRQTIPTLFPEKMSYHAFASTGLDGLFGLDRLRKAKILKINESRSGAFYNDGSAQFTFVPFPGIAQIAPAFGIVLQDFNLDGRVDWSRDRDRITESMRTKVASLGYPTDVVVERIYDPLDWQAMGMERGTPFALAHTFRQTGPFRPNNIDKRVPGLVFTGSSTLPGVGVPMVLISGKLAAERVQQYAEGRR